MPQPIDTNAMAWTQYEESETVRWRYKYFPPNPDTCHVGFGIMELPPGCNTGTAHYHMKEEEQAYVLEGTMEVRLGKQWLPMGPGDYVCFEAGDAHEHKFRNRTETPCRFLLLGERFEDDVIVYPDVDQVGVRLLRGRYSGPHDAKDRADDA